MLDLSTKLIARLQQTRRAQLRTSNFVTVNANDSALEPREHIKRFTCQSVNY